MKPAWHFVTGLCLLAIGATLGLAAERASETAGQSDASKTIRICNFSSRTVDYRAVYPKGRSSPDRDRRGPTRQRLEPGRFHLYRPRHTDVNVKLILAYGNPMTKKTLEWGMLYEFRRVKGQPEKLVVLGYRLSSPRQVAESDVADREEFEAAKKRIAELQQELRDVKQRIVALVRYTPAKLTSPLERIELGRVHLEDRRAEVEVSVPLEHDAVTPLSVNVRAELDLARCVPTGVPL